jgi:hypothetical protein
MRWSARRFYCFGMSNSPEPGSLPRTCGVIYHGGDRARADGLFYRWLTYCVDADIPELTRLARTIDSWRAELLAYFDTGGVSNGPTEATNLLIKKIKRVGHGSAISTTTGSACCCIAATTGTLSAPPQSEAAYHAQWRRAHKAAAQHR